MKKNLVYFSIFAAAAIIIIIILVFTGNQQGSSSIKVPVKFGSFEITVATTGELEAKNSEKIYGPVGLRNFRIWQIKIEDIIPDGTVVDSGEYVAALDRTELVTKIKDMELDLEKLETQFTKTQLDTTLDLRTARDNLINLNFTLEEKQIVVDQSIYEPPATQRQTKIELEKAERNYSQSVENYQLKFEKAEADMQEVSANLRKAQSEYNQMQSLLDKFTIFAPKGGMVIYRRNWDGQKQGIGATVSVWDPVVAELPNLKEMISKTYVNEIDISKVSKAQDVSIGVDAFPDKTYSGMVTEVANIGQQLPNSNAKVFEVIIELNEYDSILRPAMTTKNEILTDVIDSVLYLPLECIHANDSISYVFRSGKRQQVILGKSNENEIIVRAGLKKDDEVYLNPPDQPEDYSFLYLDREIVDKFWKEDEAKKSKPQKKGDGEKSRQEKMKNMTPDQRKNMKQGGKGKKRPS